MSQDLLKSLPAVSHVLESREGAKLVSQYGRTLVTELMREELERLRRCIGEGQLAGDELRAAVAELAITAAVAEAARALLEPRPRRVINATGVILHTNLGRSPLSESAAKQVAAAAAGYLDLEYDVVRAKRGSRLSHLQPLMDRLFPGSSFIVVNNNAAATLLCLRALSRGRQVLVSRGELVEIGGSFRIPDILALSGAKLHEVGTTNRTRVGDYESAVSARTGLILKVHASNFSIIGFTEEASVSELAALARRSNLPLLVDCGSGDLVNLKPLGIHDELPVQQVLAEGADLVSFSGDKLLGGPQAGFVVGRPELVNRLRRDPLARVCRLDRLLIGALHQTLASYARGTAFEEIPTLRMLALSVEDLERRARRVAQEVAAAASGAGRLVSVIEGVSRTGGGSSPSGERPTRLVAVAGPQGDAGPLEKRLRSGSPAIIGRLQDGRLLLDLRTVLPDEEQTLIERLSQALVETTSAGAARVRRAAKR